MIHDHQDQILTYDLYYRIIIQKYGFISKWNIITCDRVNKPRVMVNLVAISTRYAF